MLDLNTEAPDFSGALDDGSTFTLSDWRAPKNVVLLPSAEPKGLKRACLPPVFPAKAGIQETCAVNGDATLDSRLRGKDGGGQTCLLSGREPHFYLRDFTKG